MLTVIALILLWNCVQSLVTTKPTFVAVRSFPRSSSSTREKDSNGRRIRSLFSSDNNNEREEESLKLVLDSATIQQALRAEKSKYPTSESDYLAAARQRAAEARESVNSMSTDEDWIKMAAKTKAELGGGAMDDWEQSLTEAGNADSQVLIPVVDEQQDGQDPPEPKLLLF